MKITLFSLLIIVQTTIFAQFSESFFERLSPATSGKIGHYFGTETTDGALAVRFADSLDTEVQWVKLTQMAVMKPSAHICPAIILALMSGLLRYLSRG